MQNEQAVSAHVSLADRRPHRCPWWFGWALVLPGRRWLMDPDGLVAPLVEPGMRVLEVGAGTGFVTVPLAEQVGPSGRIWCIDVQARMLATLERRLRRCKLADRITTRVCEAEDLGVSDLAGSVDLAVLAYVLHEVPDPARTLQQTVATLRVGGRLLLVEPKGHCSPELFAEEIRIARALNLVSCDDLLIKKARSRQVAVFERRQ